MKIKSHYSKWEYFDVNMWCIKVTYVCILDSSFFQPLSAPLLYVLLSSLGLSCAQQWPTPMSNDNDNMVMLRSCILYGSSVASTLTSFQWPEKDGFSPLNQISTLSFHLIFVGWDSTTPSGWGSYCITAHIHAHIHGNQETPVTLIACLWNTWGLSVSYLWL